MAFKKGDRVKYTSGNHGDYLNNPKWGGCCGQIAGTIRNELGSGYLPSDLVIDVKWDNGETNLYRERDLELLNTSSKNIMTNIKEAFKLAFKSEPEKSFNKAGITDSSDSLTSDGQSVLLSWLLKKHGPDFKKEVVDPILEEMEKTK